MATWVHGLLVDQPISREKGSLPAQSSRSPSRIRREIVPNGSGGIWISTSSSIAMVVPASPRIVTHSPPLRSRLIGRQTHERGISNVGAPSPLAGEGGAEGVG